MKANNFLLLLVCLLMIGSLFVSCGSGNSGLAGRWYKIEGSDSSIPSEVELLKDGSGFAMDNAVTWKTENKRLYITHPRLAMVFDYNIIGSKLELINDKGQKFIYVSKLGGDSAFIGSWRWVLDNGEPVDIELAHIYNADGTGAIKAGTVEEKFKWAVEKNLLYLLVYKTVYKYTFEIKGETMTQILENENGSSRSEYKKQ